MKIKLVFLAFLAILVGTGLSAQGQDGLVGYWKFDDGSGTTAIDSAGGDNDGTLIGEQIGWAAGKFGGALSQWAQEEVVDGVEFPTTGMSVTGGTIAMWASLANPQPVTRGRYLFGHTTDPRWNNRIQIYMQDGTSDSRLLDLGLGDSHNRQNDMIEMPMEQWVHVALTWDAGSYVVYVDGEVVGNGNYTGLGAFHPTAAIGNDGSTAPYENFAGLIDEVKIFDRALGDVEILSAMAGEPFPYASGPTPKDGAINFDTWVNLLWRAGEFAVSHDVYLGDDYDAVNNATRDSDVFQGNQAATMLIVGFPGFPYPDGLVPGTTYYWRIDEVNEANPDSPWKGPIWSFSLPPKTAYDPIPSDGSGITETQVTLTWTAGYGAKLHTVYFGDDYDTVANATAGAPTGTASFDPGPLDAEKVYYWRVDENDGVGTYQGDVWTFTTPGAVGSPQPANGEADVTMATVLSWTAADNAASHEVYLGLDKDAVRSADSSSSEYKGSRALGSESYDAGLLEANSTYYWRVDEVYNANTVKGPVWNFTVGAYLLVEDFESYTDDDPNNQAIWQHWIDGFGVADNGAQVGYLMPPYAEQTIVHGGGQSMPLMYVNEDGVTNSEATLTLTDRRDWTAAGVSELSLWVRGGSANATEPLYVSIANSAGAPAVVANDDAEIATANIWADWRIPLQAFADQGINLSNVNQIAIGLGTNSGMAGSGGSGTVFVDDIRLYQP